MCGFVKTYNPTKTEWIWDHGFGRVENSSKLDFQYPPTDRQSPQDGMFMYTDFTGMDLGSNYTMKLDSEYVRPTQASCLTFYYLTMIFDEKNTFNIFSIDNSGNTLILRYIAISI